MTVNAESQVETEALARPPRRVQGWVHFASGWLLLGLAMVGLHQDVAWLAQPFYAWVWWGYILVLDGYCLLRRGDSLLTTRRRFFVPICLWSITFWFFFELVNAHIQNWYYVGIFPFDEVMRSALFALAAFATVFMGIFQTIDALHASGLWRRWQGRPRRVSIRTTYLIQLLGLVMATLALVFPYYLAPLIWGSFTFLVDPWNYRRGSRSLLRDFEQGDYGMLGRILLAGLICGVVWESLNFFAPQKWIYTVRGLEGFKVFEMPLLGFLGFPALALDCMAAFAMLSYVFLGNRTWEHSADLRYSLALRPMRSRSAFWSSALIQVAFWIFVSSLATPVNVASVQVNLTDLGLKPLEVDQLEHEGITRPRHLLRATNTEEGHMRLCQLLGWSPDRMDRYRQRAELYTFKGIGQDHGRLLEAVGVHSPEELSRWEPEALQARLESLGQPLLVASPRVDFVRVWILAAQSRVGVEN